MIDGVQYKTGMGGTKKEARAKAAELALEELIASLENDGIPSDVSGNDQITILGLLLPARKQKFILFWLNWFNLSIVQVR